MGLSYSKLLNLHLKCPLFIHFPNAFCTNIRSPLIFLAPLTRILYTPLKIHKVQTEGLQREAALCDARKCPNPEI